MKKLFSLDGMDFVHNDIYDFVNIVEQNQEIIVTISREVVTGKILPRIWVWSSGYDVLIRYTIGGIIVMISLCSELPGPEVEEVEILHSDKNWLHVYVGRGLGWHWHLQDNGSIELSLSRKENGVREK